MLVIGATNAGKSTFLHYVTKMQGFFNIAPLRETTNIWRFISDSKNAEEAAFTCVEIDQND